MENKIKNGEKGIMAGIITIAIDKNKVGCQVNIDGLNARELSMVSAQLGIIQTDILSEIRRLTIR